MRICTLGDLLVDVIVRLDQPLSEGADTPAVTRIGAGGQAANVAAWVAHLGGESRIVAVRARDAIGAVVAEEMSGRGVEVLGPAVDSGAGVVVALVRDGERSMITDRGAAPSLAAEDVDPAWLAGVDRLHLSGYSLLRSPIDTAAVRAARIAREAGARVSVDLSSWSAIRGYGVRAFLDRLAVVGPDVVFANEREIEEVGGPPPAPVVVITRGADGCEVHWSGGSLSLPAIAAEVVDTTGAGDAFAAGFLLGASSEDAARRGLAAAARCVAQMGAMPE